MQQVWSEGSGWSREGLGKVEIWIQDDIKGADLSALSISILRHSLGIFILFFVSLLGICPSMAMFPKMSTTLTWKWGNSNKLRARLSDKRGQMMVIKSSSVLFTVKEVSKEENRKLGESEELQKVRKVVSTRNLHPVKILLSSVGGQSSVGTCHPLISILAERCFVALAQQFHCSGGAMTMAHCPGVTLWVVSPFTCLAQK